MATSNNTKKQSTKKKSAAATKKSNAAVKNTKTSKNVSNKDMELWYEVMLILLFAFMIFLFLCNFGLVGPIGVFFKNIMFGLFGFAAYILPVLMFVGIFFCWVNKGHPAVKRKMMAGTVLFLLLGAVGELAAGRLQDMQEYQILDFYEKSVKYSNGGGVFGGSLAYFLNSTLDIVGSIIVILALGIICLVLITEKSLVKGIQKTGKAVAAKAKYDAQNMKAYAAERSQQREEYRYEQLKLREEQLKNKESQANMKKAPALPDRNRKVSGMDFKSIFSKLGEGEENRLGDDEQDILLGMEEDTKQDTPMEIESQEDQVQGSSNIVSMEALRSKADVKKQEQLEAEPAIKETDGATKTIMQVSSKTIAQSLAETDELHELRPKSSYHTQERINLVKLEQPKEVYSTEKYEVQQELTFHEPQQELWSKDADHTSQVQSGLREEVTPEAVELTYSSSVEQSQVSMVEAKKEGARPKATLKEESLVPKSAMQPMSKPYLFPPISLLQKGKNVNPRDGQKHLEETARRLQECLKTFGVNVAITDISQGPAVTRYELQPEQGVKVSKIVNLSDDIKLNLAATDIRIEAPIPGKSAIGIEVPNKENSAVAFRDLIESEEFQKFPSKISFAVGKDIAGKNVVADIAKMPHMLIAGATGSGKSVCINTLIMSILYKARPDEVKMIMIDPKVVELSSYNGIPHLLIPVVTDPKQAAGALQWGVSEMMARYEKFAEYNVRDMKGFNAKIEEKEARGEENLPKKLPQIVIIVDELADLMMVAPGEVEEAICRLAQLARAAGIHLIIATQRPSVDVITGLIKANMPSRVAFAVSSGVDSRTILDMNGAEKLLGKGDMLFYPQGYSKPVRVQGSFVSDAEVGAVVDYLKNQQIGNVNQEDIQNQINSLKSGGGNSQGAAGGRSDDKDALFADAGRFIIEKDKASIGMLQRVFKIGFNRAARIVDQLCEYGVVGDEEGTKPRKVLMSLEQFENLLEEI